MSRYRVTYPPQMLPTADDPETAAVIVCQPPLSFNDGGSGKLGFSQQMQLLVDQLLRHKQSQ